MKKTIFTLVTVVSLLFFVATPALASDAKIGIINMQNLLQKLPQMKKIGDDLKKEFGDKQKQLFQAQDNFKKDADKFRRESAVMADKDKQAAEDKLVKQQQDLQTMQTEMQREYMTSQNKRVDALMATIKSKVEKIAEQGNYDLVLIDASVAYAKKGSDITAQVLKEMGVAE